METFRKLFASLLVSVYHCFDRVVIQGSLATIAFLFSGPSPI